MSHYALGLLCSFVVVAASSSLERPADTGPRKTVAVLSFDNHTGQADYDALGKGMASMMISDLSAVQEIQLLERERLQDLVQEIDRQGTRHFDSTTAVKVGQMAGAEYVVVGAIAAIRPQMRIDTRVVRVETGEIVKAAQVTGHEDKLFELQQRLAGRLIDGLGLALSPEEQQRLLAKQDSNRIDNLSTMMNFSQALALYDRADYVGASQKMALVLQASPNSMLVRMTADKAKDRAAKSVTEQAKEKVNQGLGRLLRRKP
jgi:TolB-like protein